jgi:nitrogen fixation NifU-like protein
MNDSLILYQDEILKYGRNPNNFGPMPDSTLEINGDSPICGDHMTLALKIDDDRVVDAKFSSTACCAVCMASSSMMTDAIKGLSIRDTRSLIKTFLHMINEGSHPHDAYRDIGRLTVFARIREVPSRSECAVLAWNTLEAGLCRNDQTASSARNDTVSTHATVKTLLKQEATL